jgi:hypothetical protein
MKFIKFLLLSMVFILMIFKMSAPQNEPEEPDRPSCDLNFSLIDSDEIIDDVSKQ